MGADGGVMPLVVVGLDSGAKKKKRLKMAAFQPRESHWEYQDTGSVYL